MLERLSLVVLLLCAINSCTSSNFQSTTPDAASVAPFANAIADAGVMGKWSRSCALCHVDGVADAPLVGDTQEWQRRLAQGEDQVMKNVLEGLNSMPPLGYCMSCEIDDFKAMIGFMAGTNQ